MAKKIYILGLVLVQFVGEGNPRLLGRTLNQSKNLDNGDMFLVDEARAMSLCRGTQYERVDTGDDLMAYLMAYLATPSTSSGTDGSDVTTIVMDDDETVMPPEPSTPSTGSGTDGEEAVVVTRVNVMSVDIKDIKAACKEHKITIGKKNRDALISLLLPFLD